MKDKLTNNEVIEAKSVQSSSVFSRDDSNNYFYIVDVIIIDCCLNRKKVVQLFGMTGLSCKVWNSSDCSPGKKSLDGMVREQQFVTWHRKTHRLSNNR